MTMSAGARRNAQRRREHAEAVPDHDPDAVHRFRSPDQPQPGLGRAVRTTTLPGTDVPTSALGLGTAELFRMPSATDRLRMLFEAHNVGVRHFDTAPMYGLGLAESELGRFARGRRDQLTIATKFGIAPTRTGRALGRVQGPIRRLLAAAPALRERARSSATGPGVGPAGSLLYERSGYDAAAARRSLEASLRALATDCVDLYLLHEPSGDDMRSADVRAWLEHARDAGMIRAWGVAGEPDLVGHVVDVLGPGTVRQVREDPFLRAGAVLDPTPRVTFGALSRAMPRLVSLLGGGLWPDLRWADLDLDPGDRAGLARLLLRDALRGNPDGVLLLGTTDPGHLRVAAEVASMNPRNSAPDLDVLATALRTPARRRT
ncbi:aldo/keto reductase [Actinomycetospora cinnamomea]|uniref:aldo/keto reductase n=1 Tax=Actinomycetospora cinnamomea TaxID=663609 RepID=UPI000E323FC0|nr:aldo/keto reductase [Actinomycetospora cinnamomea]